MPVKVFGKVEKYPDGSAALFVKSWDHLLAMMREEFLPYADSREVTITIEPTEDYFISSRQRGYIFGHIGPEFKRVFRQKGISFTDVRSALLYAQSLPNIDFMEDVVDNMTGEIKRIPKSFADKNSTRKEIATFIDNAFMWLIYNGGSPKAPKQYHTWKRIQRLRKEGGGSDTPLATRF